MRISVNLLTITSTWQSRHPGRRSYRCQLTSSSALSPSLVSTHLASASHPPFFQQTGRHFSPALRRALSCRRTRVASALYGLRFSTNRIPLLASSGGLSRVNARELCWHVVASVSTNRSHFSPACWRTLSRRRTRVASALRGLHFSTNRTPLLTSSLAGSLVASDPRLRPLGHHFSPAQQPAGALSRADGVLSALTTMCPRSPTRRTLPLASMPAHWLSHVSTCISFRIACSARLTVRGCHHAHIKVVSTGIKPYASAPVSLIHSYTMGTFAFLCGASSAVCVAGSFSPGRQLTRPHSTSGKPPVAFASSLLLCTCLLYVLCTSPAPGSQPPVRGPGKFAAPSICASSL